MSCNYAEGLSPYHDKGQLGLEEKFDTKSVVSAKVSLLSKWINEAKHVVIHTGAGISTSAGIPDFRGPQGVWTLEAKGEKPDTSKDFNEAIPTITHMAIMKLVDKKKVKFVVSQNIDGLHLRSNLPRQYLSELHGNMFTEQCSSCNRQFVRSTPVPSVGQKSLNKPCPTLKANGRPCRGRLHDTILDWEHNLPENDLGMADYHSCLADLSICLGTTMQIVPSGNLPLYTKKHGGKLVIVNLQPTKHDRKADLLIHAYVDEVMTMLMKNLNIKIPKYSPKNDPSRTLSNLPEKFLEWTISDKDLQKMKKIYEEKCGSKEAKKRLEMIDDDVPLHVTKTIKRKAKDDEDSDLEVLDVIVKPKKTREKKKGSKKNAPPVYNTTITIKKVIPPPKKIKYEGTTEKITIKKNVTPTKTKYEIVTKPKKVPKCEIVYCTDQNNDQCNDLDMICESDDDEMTNNFTYNFKRYLYDDVKKEEIKEESFIESDKKVEIKEEIKNEIKLEEEETKGDTKIKEENQEEKKEERVGDQKNEEDLDKTGNVPETTEGSTEKNSTNKPDTELSAADKKEENVINPSVEETQILNDKTTEVSEEAKANEKKTDFSNQNDSISINESKENDPKPTTESEKKTDEKELSELIGASELENPSEPENASEKKEKDKSENLYQNIESELSNLSNSNLETIDQMVNQAHDNSIEMANSSINENYEFYGGEYNSTNNSTDLDYYNF